MAKKAKPKKRDVNPGTTEDVKIGDALKIRLPNDFVVSESSPMPFTPAPLTLCGQLEDAILLLENRISNSIAKINSLM